LRRAIELLAYFNRDNQPAARRELADQEMLEMQKFMGTPSPMSEEMKEAIRWAEAQKAKHRID
jgi:hypothetical protein